MREKDVIVIGAGLTGLTCSMRLKELGKDVELLEKEDRIGGLMQTDYVEGFVMERGPGTGTVKYPEVAELFDRLGDFCSLESATAASGSRLIWKGNKFRPLPCGLISAFTTPLFSWKDKFRILGEPWRKKGTDPNESVGALAERRLGKSFVDYAVDPFLSGVYAGDPYKLPTRLALPKLYNLEQTYGGFIRGHIQLMKRTKTEREKRATKAIFSTQGGFHHLVSALGKAVGHERISLNCKDIRVEPYGDKWKVKWGTETVLAKDIVTTCPAYSLPDVLSFLPKSDLQVLGNLYYAPVIEIGVGIKDTEGIVWNSFGGLVPSCEHKDVLGILMPSACFRERSPKGGATFAYFIGGVRHPEYLEKSDEELTRLVNDTLHTMLGYPEGKKADVIKIYRHKQAIPQYLENTDDRLAMISKIEKLYPGLHIAGNIKDGIGMGDRIKQAVDTAESLCS